MTELQFQDELPEGITSDRRNRHPHHEWAAQMKANPGKWAKLYAEEETDSPLAVGTISTMASHIRRGGRVAYQPAGSFEAKVSVSKRELWARYIGSPGD